MKEEIEKRRAEAAERKKQMEEGESAKPTFAINPKGSTKVTFEAPAFVLSQTRIFYVLSL